VAAASFVARYRSTAGVERVQLEWFAFAAGLVAVGYVVDVLMWAASRTFAVQVAGLGVLVLVLCFTSVPVACGVAVLRYRLYDIDRVVSRTVAYLLLTGIVVGVYALVVTAASAVLPDSASQAVVAGATLAAAAAFEPARRHVQRLVDHRFNRQRYDARRLVERYADGLAPHRRPRRHAAPAARRGPRGRRTLDDRDLGAPAGGALVVTARSSYARAKPDEWDHPPREGTAP
jgi:hypothetical protein